VAVAAATVVGVGVAVGVNVGVLLGVGALPRLKATSVEPSATKMWPAAAAGTAKCAGTWGNDSEYWSTLVVRSKPSSNWFPESMFQM
jgi:hypothetical protein